MPSALSFVSVNLFESSCTMFSVYLAQMRAEGLEGLFCVSIREEVSLLRSLCSWMEYSVKYVEVDNTAQMGAHAVQFGNCNQFVVYTCTVGCCAV